MGGGPGGGGAPAAIPAEIVGSYVAAPVDVRSLDYGHNLLSGCVDTPPVPASSRKAAWGVMARVPQGQLAP